MRRVSSCSSSARLVCLRPTAPIVRGAAWLKTHQRQSGRWFTFSINTDEQRDDNRYTDHLISNIGTAYAVMALRACGELQDTDNQ